MARLVDTFELPPISTSTKALQGLIQHIAIARMDTDIEVTTAGILEPVESKSISKSISARWTQAYTDWNEEVSDYSTDEDSSFSSYHSKSVRRRRGGPWIICALVLLTAIIAGVLVAVFVPSNNKDRSTEDINVSDETQPSPSPTEGPLPEECVPSYNNVDYCLSQELSSQEAEACVDCVWTFLPPDDGNCPLLQNSVCNILDQCACGTCAIYLEEYLDCQSICDVDCQLVVPAAARGGE